jgi:hypothetical protein
MRARVPVCGIACAKPCSLCCVSEAPGLRNCTHVVYGQATPAPRQPHAMAMLCAAAVGLQHTGPAHNSHSHSQVSCISACALGAVGLQHTGPGPADRSHTRGNMRLLLPPAPGVQTLLSRLAHAPNATPSSAVRLGNSNSESIAEPCACSLCCANTVTLPATDPAATQALTTTKYCCCHPPPPVVGVTTWQCRAQIFGASLLTGTSCT